MDKTENHFSRKLETVGLTLIASEADNNNTKVQHECIERAF